MKNNCRYCGKPVKRAYCDNQCQGNHRQQKKWDKVDPADISKSLKQPRSMKKYLVSLYGEKCDICGIDSWQGKVVPLVLDHVDGNPYDNSLENLRLVCGNCDMQLPTYKSKNLGNGRHYRRDRYDKGQSY